MATAASPRQMMYAQILSQPALLLEVFDATERRSRRRSASFSHSAGKRSTPPGVATRFTLVWRVRWLLPVFVNCL